jgi:hypothetical protein
MAIHNRPRLSTRALCRSRNRYTLPTSVDDEGEELPDDAAAIEAARQTVREMVRDGPPTVPEERVVVSNEKGELVDKVYLEDYLPEAPSKWE